MGLPFDLMGAATAPSQVMLNQVWYSAIVVPGYVSTCLCSSFLFLWPVGGPLDNVIVLRRGDSARGVPAPFRANPLIGVANPSSPITDEVPNPWAGVSLNAA